MLDHLRKRLILSLVIAVAVIAGLLIYADLRAVAAAVAHFRWELLPLIIGLTLVNYALRFVKWQYFLDRIGISGVPVRDSLLIYFSAFALTITPGKVGEWLKSYFLHQSYRVPVARSAPILLAERLTDGIALLLLAGTGVVAFSYGTELVLLLVAGFAGVIAVMRCSPLTRLVLRLAARVPVLRRHTGHLEIAVASLSSLLSPASLVFATLLGVISWSAECVAFFFVLVGLGSAPSWDHLLKAIFILPITSLAGAVLFLPGGLGAVEGGIAGLTQALLAFSRGQAAAAALLIRLATLWLAVVLGVGAFAIFTRHRGLDRSGLLAEDEQEAPEAEPAAAPAFPDPTSPKP